MSESAEPDVLPPEPLASSDDTSGAKPSMETVVEPGNAPIEPATATASADAEPSSSDSPLPPAELQEPAPPASNKKWYIIKVTSGREESIKAAIERRVKVEGLEPYFGQIHIPVEKIVEVKKVKERKNGETITKEKRVTKERKKFPGYIMAEVEFNDQILYLFRETNGVADFVGGASATKPPTPMEDIDVQRMMGDSPIDSDSQQSSARKKPKTVVKLDYEKGDKVRIREGTFANMIGEVKSIVFPKEGENPQVTVVVEVIGRPIDVTLEYWHIDKM